MGLLYLIFTVIKISKVNRHTSTNNLDKIGQLFDKMCPWGIQIFFINLNEILVLRDPLHIFIRLNRMVYLHNSANPRNPHNNNRYWLFQLSHIKQ